MQYELHYSFREIMKPMSPEYTIDMAPSSADTSGYQRRPVTDSATSRGSPSIMSSEAHMVILFTQN